MSVATDRLLQAHTQFEQALAELMAAHQGLSDEEYTPQMPSVLVCGYKPLEKEGHFTLMGHVTHAAEALEHALNEPENAPFREELLEVMERRVFSSLFD